LTPRSALPATLAYPASAARASGRIRAPAQAYRASARASGNQNASLDSSTPETMPRIAASASSLRSGGPDDAAASQRLRVNAAALTGVIGSSSVVVILLIGHRSGRAHSGHRVSKNCDKQQPRSEISALAIAQSHHQGPVVTCADTYVVSTMSGKRPQSPSIPVDRQPPVRLFRSLAASMA
jgi:hypothetical protein